MQKLHKVINKIDHIFIKFYDRCMMLLSKFINSDIFEALRNICLIIIYLLAIRGCYDLANQFLLDSASIFTYIISGILYFISIVLVFMVIYDAYRCFAFIIKFIHDLAMKKNNGDK